MSTQESSGDASQDLVDAFPPFLISSRNNAPAKSAPEPNTLHEAMEIQEKEWDSGNRRYSMTNRRLALIINNENFHRSTQMGTRTGSSKDVEAIKNVLESVLGFNVTTRENLTVNEMKKQFKEISVVNHAHNDCFVCVLLSHGDDGGIIYGTDGEVKLDDLISYVLPNKCQSLAGKPKLFFVQACRGTRLDEGYEAHDAIGGFGAPALPAQKVPLWADMLIAYSSVSGYYSWRNSRNGSWFIQSLAFVLREYGTSLEIQQMMTKVNFRVAYEYESRSDHVRMNRMKQVPCVASMLTKELYFPPPTLKS